MHEPLTWYENCQARERNKGLYTADQNLNNREYATYTRQGNDARRYGYECPEERDYYPYWHPTPWRDIAVFTDDVGRCSHYKGQSQNRKGKGMCCNKTIWDTQRTCVQLPGLDPTGQNRNPGGANNPGACSQYESIGHSGYWINFGHWGASQPKCERTPFSRDNHLGNSIPKASEAGELSGMSRAPSFRWTLPKAWSEELTCVLRMRYNVSTTDFDYSKVTSEQNGDNAPLPNGPNANFVGLATHAGTNFPLKLNINTNQYGRTFEDRSHTFKIVRRTRSRLPECREKVIHNLNVRGRRGNIVQVYPAVEYDFVPNKLELWEGECVHFQWTGSDANPPGNAGNGRRMTDRTNIVEIPHLGKNKPTNLGYDAHQDGLRDRAHWSNLCGRDEWLCRKLAYIDQEVNLTTGLPTLACDDALDPNQGNNEDRLDNCKELNAAPGYFDTGPVVMDFPQTLYYMSTRNNDFTNRSQKATIVVKAWRVLLIIACCVVGFLLLWGFFWVWARRARYDPEHKLHRMKYGARVVWALDKGAELYTRSPLHWAPWSVGLVCFCGVLYGAGFWLAGGGPLAKLEDPAPLYLHAKACGRVLDVLCNLIFLPVLRNFTSWLRTTPLTQVLPLGEEIYFHKVIACLLALAGLGHVYCHYVDFAWHEEYGYGISFAEQAYGTWSGFSGLLILLCMVIMFATAIERVRRRRWTIGWGKYKWSFGGHSAFVRIHKLWVVVLVLLWSHSRAFWHYSLAPTALLILDKLIGRLRGKNPVELLEAYSPARDVMGLKLQLRTRRRFHYKSGQYLFLNCPAISPEWHPFTISSSPEERHFSVHIRCRPDMDWTFALKMALMPDAKTKAAQLAAREKIKQFEQEQAAAAADRATRETTRKERRQLAITAGSLRGRAYALYGRLATALRRSPPSADHEGEGQQLEAAEGGRQAAEPASPRLEGLPADGAPASDASWAVGDFFSNLFGANGGGETGAAVAVPTQAPLDDERSSAPTKMSKAEMKSTKGMFGASKGKSHKDDINSSREHPGSSAESRPLRFRPPRVRTGASESAAPAAQLPDASKLPAPSSTPSASASGSDGPSLPASPPPSPPTGGTPLLTADGHAVELFVDGPYGSASEEVFGFEVLVLVGAGIGVTPFASILKTLAIQAKQDRLETPLKKVAFYWVCRDDKEFETFRDLLVGIVDDQALAKIFELNTYITGELDLKKARADKTYGYNQFAGRPDWNRIGRELRNDYPDSDVGVFLCGPNAIGQQLVGMCNKYNPPKPTGPARKRPKQPRFYFHKETF